MFGPPMGPPPIHSKTEAPKMPKGFQNKVSFIGRSFKETFRRLFYIFTLVYKSQPIIIILMAFMALFNGVQSIIGAYITKWLMDGLQKAVEGTLGDFWQLGGLLLLQIVFQLFVLVISSVNRMITRLSNELFVYSIKIKIMKKAKTIDLSKVRSSLEFIFAARKRDAGSRQQTVAGHRGGFQHNQHTDNAYQFHNGSCRNDVLGTDRCYTYDCSVRDKSHINTEKRCSVICVFTQRNADNLPYYAQLLTDKDLVKEVKAF